MPAFHQPEHAKSANSSTCRSCCATPTTGQQIVNASVNWGEALPQTIAAESLSAMQEALKTGKPTISNAFYGVFINRFFVTAGIPVSRGDQIAYYLLVAIPADTFSDALRNAAVPGQWIVALIDRANTIIARSERHSEYAGTKVNFDFMEQTTNARGRQRRADPARRRLPLDAGADRPRPAGSWPSACRRRFCERRETAR